MFYKISYNSQGLISWELISSEVDFVRVDHVGVAFVGAWHQICTTEAPRSKCRCAYTWNQRSFQLLKLSAPVTATVASVPGYSTLVKRNLAHRKARKCNTPEAWKIYRMLCNNATAVLRSAKSSYYYHLAGKRTNLKCSGRNFTTCPANQLPTQYQLTLLVTLIAIS